MGDAFRSIVVQVECERDDRGHRSSQSDKCPCGGDVDRLPDLVEGTPHVVSRCVDLRRRRWVVMQMTFGQPNAADVDRSSRAHALGVTQNELRRAATDVTYEV